MTVEMKTEERTPHPRKNDPLEQRIRKLIEEQACSTEKGKQMFSKVNSLQVEYFKKALASLGNPDQIHEDTQKLLKDLAEATNSKIVDGKENLAGVPKESPVMVVSNHYGGFKLVMIPQNVLGIDVGQEKIDDVPPFPIYYAGIKPVADELGDELYDAHLELPGPLLKIQEAAGLLVIPENEGIYEETKKRTQELFSKRPNSMLVVFSEAGTSGKRNMGGPYDLDNLHGGAFSIAQELNVPILPVCQYFNPESGFEIGILKPVLFDSVPDNGDITARKEYFNRIANQTRSDMQTWLNSKKTS